MKKLFIFTLIISLAIILQGCRKKHIGPDNGYVWYEVTKHGLYGAYDENGKELLPCTFQSIILDDDWKDGNNSLDYEWQLLWHTVDENGDSLIIRQYEFEDGWRYYWMDYYKHNHSEKVSIMDYDNVVFPYGQHSIYPLFHKEACPGMRKLRYFWVRERIALWTVKDGIYKEDGTPIIPIERGLFGIRPVEQDGKVWYTFMTKYGGGICDAYGNEIFRYRDEDCCRTGALGLREYSKHTWYNNRLVYDPKKGFGSVQVRKIEDEYGSCTFDYYIRYTGITIGDYSTSFDVEPSGNNDTAAIINLEELSIDLLYKGMYVYEDGYNRTTGQMYPNFQKTETILIYEDSLSGGIHAKYEGMNYGKRVYVAKPYTDTTQYGMYNNSTIITTRYYVSSTYDIQEHQTWSSNWSTMYITSNLIKEGTDYCPAIGNYGNITIYPSPTPPIVTPTTSHLTAAQYQRIYDGYENVVKGVLNHFRIDPDMNYAPRTQNMRTLQNAQNNMRRIRQEAASYGITIQQSNYETASP